MTKKKCKHCGGEHTEAQCAYYEFYMIYSAK